MRLFVEQPFGSVNRRSRKARSQLRLGRVQGCLRLAFLPPYVWLVNLIAVEFVSERVGNYQYNSQWGVLLNQLWSVRGNGVYRAETLVGDVRSLPEFWSTPGQGADRNRRYSTVLL